MYYCMCKLPPTNNKPNNQVVNTMEKLVETKCKNGGKKIVIQKKHLRSNRFCTLGCMNLSKNPN